MHEVVAITSQSAFRGTLRREHAHKRPWSSKQVITWLGAIMNKARAVHELGAWIRAPKLQSIQPFQACNQIQISNLYLFAKREASTKPRPFSAVHFTCGENDQRGTYRSLIRQHPAANGRATMPDFLSQSRSRRRSSHEAKHMRLGMVLPR